jgi:Tfp pilus assembly pilus retraction ATPase PilT
VHIAPRRSAKGAQKHVPRQVRRVCEAEDGLLLVAAATQPELLTMLGAVADLAARARAGYVICLEPATGLPFTAESAFISERQMNGSAHDLASTVRRASQEGPDLLVAGPVTSAPALEELLRTGVAPGRLVIMGVVATTALRAVESILSTISPDRAREARAWLAAGLRAAFGVRGLRRVGGGRATIQDVLVGTREVRALLEHGDLAALEQLQRQGAEGMRTLDAALARAVARKQVTLRHAASHAASRAELVAMMRKDARERRRMTREHRSDRRPGVLRAITAG